MSETTPITQHEGKKYLRKIWNPSGEASIEVDVYCVIKAFGITCPAIAHAVKKLLAPGQRGKGDVIADLKGVLAAVNRAVELEEIEQRENKPTSQVILDQIRAVDGEPQEPADLFLFAGGQCTLKGSGANAVVKPAWSTEEYPIPVLGDDGRCICNVVTKCPLLRTGTANRCTEEDFITAKVPYRKTIQGTSQTVDTSTVAGPNLQEIIVPNVAGAKWMASELSDKSGWCLSYGTSQQDSVIVKTYPYSEDMLKEAVEAQARTAAKNNNRNKVTPAFNH